MNVLLSESALLEDEMKRLNILLFATTIRTTQLSFTTLNPLQHIRHDMQRACFGADGIFCLLLQRLVMKRTVLFKSALSAVLSAHSAPCFLIWRNFQHCIWKTLSRTLLKSLNRSYVKSATKSTAKTNLWWKNTLVRNLSSM